MAKTLTLASDSAVPVQGNFSAERAVAGKRYSIVVRAKDGPKVATTITAQKFAGFSMIVSLPAGKYAIGDSGKEGSVYVIDPDGNSDSTMGAADVTSTLDFGTNDDLNQRKGAQGT